MLIPLRTLTQLLSEIKKKKERKKEEEEEDEKIGVRPFGPWFIIFLSWLYEDPWTRPSGTRRPKGQPRRSNPQPILVILMTVLTLTMKNIVDCHVVDGLGLVSCPRARLIIMMITMMITMMKLFIFTDVHSFISESFIKNKLIRNDD